MDKSEARLNRHSPPEEKTISPENTHLPVSNPKIQTSTGRFWVVPCLLILSGICLNQWLFHPFLILHDDQLSILRLILIWGYDVSAVMVGLLMLIRKDRESLSLRKILFFGLMLALMAIGMELILQVLVWVVPSIDSILTTDAIPAAVPDPQYGMVPNPRYPGHDTNGFRNRTVPSQVDCVTIGDSFTYGFGVQPNQNWPSQFQRQTGWSVYNMSFNGYGPIEELMLLKRAVDLRPSLVILAMFVGNDAYDAYRSAYYRNLFPEFKTQDTVLLKAIQDRERRDPFEKTAVLQSPGSPSSADGIWVVIKRIKLLRLYFAAEAAVQRRIYDWIANSPSMGFRKERRMAREGSDFFEVFETPDLTTILVPPLRYRGVNLEDPRIEEGLRISFQALQEMIRIADAHAIELLVVLIPTKERVIYELYPKYKLTPSEMMDRVAKQEDEVRRRNLDFLNERKISHIDLLAELKDRVTGGERLYFIDQNTHFTPEGNKVVAKIVHEYLKNESLGPRSP